MSGPYEYTAEEQERHRAKARAFHAAVTDGGRRRPNVLQLTEDGMQPVAPDPFALLDGLVLTDPQPPAATAITGFGLYLAEKSMTPAPAGLCCRFGTCHLCREADRKADARTPAELRL